MNIWLRKSFVIMVSVMTFGLVTPPLDLFDGRTNADSNSEREAFESFSKGSTIARNNAVVETEELKRQEFINEMMLAAEKQAFEKFGPKIKPVVEDEFKELILPNIQRAIEEVAFQFPEDELSNLRITEKPGAGLSEKIFHIKDGNTSKDIIRFHVRRDHPPQSGYWFNFHYHTYQDEFQSHHVLGSIYWDKNTPPKWMAN